MNEVHHLRALQAFDTAATHSSLSRAAETLGVTHGAVSRQIKQLETYLGVHLLHRRPNGVEKTDAGEQLHKATRQAFAALQTGIRSVKRAQDRRAITISLSASLATKWLVPRLPAFRTKHPGIALYLDTNDEVIDFDDSDVDVALRYGVPDWPNLHYERLVDEQLVVVASPALVAGEDLPMTPAAISGLPLLHDQFDPAWGKWANAVGLDQSLVEAADLKYRDSAVLITAAIDGQGVALARRLLVQDDLGAGRVVRLDTTTISPDRELYFVCRAGDEERVLIRSFRNWLLSLC
ncbi:transcriptional regulator GcvA [Pelagibius sp. Alg239-R121]|uniref:transcriptional regulator GcvA n=1 Tax=Pelagibius sp. Alg239-R121 TaxID=2993448 RepID=UPI0024A74808|nr:transcriptional regulator GcvA [Pelagibius sp. Alg239-R121]